MVRELDVERAVESRCATGEGPVWHEGRLWWVDIPNCSVHSFDPRTGAHDEWAFDESIGAIVPSRAGGFLAATKSGFARLDDRTGALTSLAAVGAADPRTRMNDGKCDPQGRFWAGTMSEDPWAEPTAGTLYRLGCDGSVTPVLSGLGISNGLGWDSSGRSMHFIDSFTWRVDVFDFDPVSGTPSNRRPLVVFPRDDGVLPDGLCVDAEDHLWVALWGGSCVKRFTHEGMLDAVVRLPVSRVTSCAFGGEDLGDLYITTAAEGVEEEEPLAGSLFRCRPGVKGRPVQTACV